MMTKWYIKAFAKLTGTSVRTLHHYDDIDLLKPSLRSANGYRLYSQADLNRMQQIIALKSFGFKLTQIKELLAQKMSLKSHLLIQLKFLEDKKRSLNNTMVTLEKVISECVDDQLIDWKSTTALIEVYRMTEHLQKTWAGKVLNEHELKVYAEFESELTKKRPNTEKAFKKRWQGICQEIKDNMAQAPTSEIAIKIAEKVHGAIYNLYGKKYAALKHAIWEKGFKTGANQPKENYGLTPEMVQWLDTAMGAYWQKRNRQILMEIGQKPDSDIIEAFTLALREMYGDEMQLKLEFFQMIYHHEAIPQQTKDWIRKHQDALL
ncbi:MerR family transcriptional regulator [Thiotrichales bacterium 19S3-7]|nr:MerR family transcriptional regulator [Thiotrichales bacterium 19S3-7]MCF6800591.1 MerR family transcriptional regulator [Thiotrichales bacterium 19S3-11]